MYLICLSLLIVYFIKLQQNKTMGGGNSSYSKTVNEITNQIMQKSMTNIWNKSAVSIKVINQNRQEIKLIIGNITVKSATKCRLIDIQQEIQAETKLLTKIDTEFTNDLKSELKSELSNVLKSNSTLTKGFLADIGIGNSDSSEAINRVTNRVEQIIDKTITNETLTEILAKNYNEQSQTINVGDITLDNCDESTLLMLKQSIQSMSMAQTISSDLAKNILEDTVLSRMATDAQASSELSKKGLDDLFGSMLIPLIILGVLFLLGIGGAFTATTLLAKKIFIGILLLSPFIAIYLSVAYLNDWYPFTNITREYWKCVRNFKGEVNDCIQVEDIEEGKEFAFKSKDACKLAIERGEAPCGQYWGCEKTKTTDGMKKNTGRVVKFSNAADGPYKSVEEAKKETKNCANTWYCKREKNGLFKEPKECTDVDPDESGISYNKITTQNVCNNDMKCVNYWGCLTLEEETKDKEGNKKPARKMCKAYTDRIEDPTGSLVFIGGATKEECDLVCK